MEIRKNLTEDEAKDLAIELVKDDNTVEAIKSADGTYSISWIKNKKYISYDGKEFTDEVWTTKDGEMMCIQDLSEDHAKNVIRMMLRMDRQISALAQNIMDTMPDIGDAIDEITASVRPTLH